ncbi:unnamed protein product [Periconia digitata]|uniref:Uncharacterized protein n=1 Tax=Periconia digitata TaxID=1303443 RepID=A0A9W4XI31_9PLEO|nr:unnamed protein product [Periconia digitata]
MRIDVLSLYISLVGCSHGSTLSTLLYLQHRLLYLLPHQLSVHMTSLVETRLPVFVHDLRHSWIEDKANLAWLEQRPDPLHDLCDPSGEIEGQPPSRVIPRDLFDRLDIDNNRYQLPRGESVDRHAWINLQNRLEEMKKCPAALQQVTYLNLEIFLSAFDEVDPNENTIELLADVLLSMPNLAMLRWNIPTAFNPRFEKTFARRGVKLMGVTHLTVGSKGHFIISVCPNIEDLKNEIPVHYCSWKPRLRWEESIDVLLQVFSGAKKLRNLSIGCMDTWSPEFAREIVVAVPNLVQLTMMGQLINTWSESGMEATALVHSVLYALREAHNLTTLHLPESYDLGLGFDGGPFCGNAYMGPSGYLTSRQTMRGHITAVDQGILLAWTALPHLKNITIAGTPPVSVQRDEKGQVMKVTHEWTGRVEQYLEEEYPAPKKGDIVDGELVT